MQPGDTTGDTNSALFWLGADLSRRMRLNLPNNLRTQVDDEITDVTASPYLSAVFGAGDSASFWKRGSFRSGSNIGSSRSSAGVSGTFEASGASYGVESSFCKAATARSGSPVWAAARARISIGAGPDTASFSIGTMAIARS